jgi:hypothetical protein
MKKIKLIVGLIFIVIASFSQEQKVDYFGLKLTEEIPEKFAPPFISKDERYVLMSAFSPDGKQFCYTTTNEHWSHFEIWYTRYYAPAATVGMTYILLSSAKTARGPNLLVLAQKLTLNMQSFLLKLALMVNT